MSKIQPRAFFAPATALLVAGITTVGFLWNPFSKTDQGKSSSSAATIAATDAVENIIDLNPTASNVPYDATSDIENIAQRLRNGPVNDPITKALLKDLLAANSSSFEKTAKANLAEFLKSRALVEDWEKEILSQLMQQWLNGHTPNLLGSSALDAVMDSNYDRVLDETQTTYGNNYIAVRIYDFSPFTFQNNPGNVVVEFLQWQPTPQPSDSNNLTPSDTFYRDNDIAAHWVANRYSIPFDPTSSIASMNGQQIQDWWDSLSGNGEGQRANQDQVVVKDNPWNQVASIRRDGTRFNQWNEWHTPSFGSNDTWPSKELINYNQGTRSHTYNESWTGSRGFVTAGREGAPSQFLWRNGRLDLAILTRGVMAPATEGALRQNVYTYSPQGWSLSIQGRGNHYMGIIAPDGTFSMPHQNNTRATPTQREKSR